MEMSSASPLVFDHFHFARRVWEFIMYILCLLNICEMTFLWTFRPIIMNIYVILTAAIDFLFLVDILIQLRTGFIQHGIIQRNQSQIRAKIKTWKLVIQFIYVVPFYLIGFFANNDFIFRILILVKILRFMRLIQAYILMSNTLVYVSPYSRLFRLFAILVTVIHCFACLFWYTGNTEIPEKSWLTELDIAVKPLHVQYFDSIYYITTTIFTIGYGDVHPFTYDEICVVIVIQAVGVIFYNFFISNLVSIVADPSRDSFLTKYQRVYSAFKWRGVSDDSLKELLQYYEYVWEKDRDRSDFYETASRMPYGLQKKLALALHMEVFEKVNAFQGASLAALQDIAMALRPKIYAPGDFLVKMGRASNKIIFLTEGKVEFISPRNTSDLILDGASGCILGEASVTQGEVEISSVVARTYVEAFELTKEDFIKLRADHQVIRNNLIRGPSYNFT